MAGLKGWLDLNTTSGSGNATVQVASVSEHTGRSSRETVLNIQSVATSVPKKTVTVTQSGKFEFVKTNVESTTVPKEGQLVTITGYSNSKALHFTVGGVVNEDDDLLEIGFPGLYTAAGTQYNNGESITGDPGASAQYEWSTNFEVLVNTNVKQKSVKFIVSTNSSASTANGTVVVEIMQTAGDPYLTVSVSKIELDYTGAPKELLIQSNTSWTIS